MLSYLKSFYSYFFPDKFRNKIDADKELFLAEQLVNLQITEQDTEDEVPFTMHDIPQDSVCYQRTGVITYMENNYILIDGMIFFDITACSLNLQVMDKVLYLCYKDVNDSIFVIRILENQEVFWGDEKEAVDECSYNMIEHTFVGEVAYREERKVFIKDSNLKFNLDDVTATFIPIKGDWLELLCKVKYDADKPMDISLDMIVEVLSFKPVRRTVKSTIITNWTGESGICDKQFYFDKHCITNHCQPTIGSKALIEAIESDQSPYAWRVIKMHITENMILPETKSSVMEDIQQRSLEVERKKNIEVTFPVKFENIHFRDIPCITLDITNNSDQQIVINKWIILCKKRDSQVNISPFLNKPKTIYPRQTFSLTITCNPKFYGRSKEHLIVMFKGFQVERLIEINVLTDIVIETKTRSDTTIHKTQAEMTAMLKYMRNNSDKTIVPGVKQMKTPNFIAVRLGIFPIPDKVWSAVLGNSNETMNHLDYYKILSRIEIKLPCLIQNLNINNYTDKWHTLLYMEEIQININMRCYDVTKGFLIKCQDYLGIEISGLAEKRPSLIVGDKVIVKDVWDNNMPSYEGFIHLIKGDLVLIKFHPQFHENYSGSDVSIKFYHNRSVYRRGHQAINLAISNLGADILMPNHIQTHPPQLSNDKIEAIKWYNNNLNKEQKRAVKNILLGECRPMPYCIYGPPGTGKTITVIETILQILAVFPDSRILVTAPSNSAANLITERLLEYKKSSISIVRLIANYLVDSENIPHAIKSYCATINIAREETVKSSHVVKNGINLNVPASYIARYRVSIATCYTVGVLAMLDLPKGHFTHIIVDEAGQALEPEIMIPLTFIDKQNGQIVLAGDPMQLGPIVLSKYCKEFSYGESYFSRILETFPYQRDYHAFENGFNDKLVTRLSDNYRSLEEVITLPSEMFYDASLIAKLNRGLPWIRRILDVFSEMYETSGNPKTGGIFINGIKGCNIRAEDSPSWFNPQEASMIALTVCKLFKKNINPEEIGIISPYTAQIKHIRLLFDAMGLPQPKIGTVEEFQGQERPIIIISTVRTTESQITIDQKHALGFVKNPKRLNVALTRAQVAVLLFCDPHLFLCDPLWQKVINHAVKNFKYVGCDLPQTHDMNKITDNFNIE